MLRPLLAVLVAAGALVPVAAAPADAARTSVSHRVETRAPQVGAALVVSGQVRPQGKRKVVLQRKVGSRWVAWARDTTDRKGRYRVAARPAGPGRLALRVTVSRTRQHRPVTSKAFAVTVAPKPTPPPAPCRPGPAPVDRLADEATTALLATLDTWRCSGRMAVGQQVNISSDTWDRMLDVAPSRFRVVGFDLTELQDAIDAGKPERIDDLAALAADGHVLTATWHARNPWTGGAYDDRSGGVDLAELVDPATATPANDAFWAAWDEHLASLAALGAQGVPVVVKPLHEAAGGWFWWGHPDPATYRTLYARLQARAAAAGVHNLLWAYAAAPRTWSGVHDPVALVPKYVDLGGIDTYDCEVKNSSCGLPKDAADAAVDRLDLTSYAAVDARVPRMALTEVGPAYSDGSWNPKVVTDTLRRTGTNAVWAMFWFNDGAGEQWKKAVRSLAGGPAWLASCPDGFCRVPGGVG